MQNVRYSVFSVTLIFVCVEISISKYNQRKQPFFFSPSLSLVSYLSLYIWEHEFSDIQNCRKDWHVCPWCHDLHAFVIYRCCFIYPLLTLGSLEIVHALISLNIIFFCLREIMYINRFNHFRSTWGHSWFLVGFVLLNLLFSFMCTALYIIICSCCLLSLYCLCFWLLINRWHLPAFIIKVHNAYFTFWMRCKL